MVAVLDMTLWPLDVLVSSGMCATTAALLIQCLIVLSQYSIFTALSPLLQVNFTLLLNSVDLAIKKDCVP